MDYHDLLNECRDSAKEEVNEEKALTATLVMDVANRLSVGGEKVRISDIIKQVRNESGGEYMAVRKLVRDTLMKEGWDTSLMSEKSFKISWQNLDEPHGELRHFNVEAEDKAAAEHWALNALKSDGIPKEFIEIKSVDLDESKVNEEEFAEPSMQKPGKKLPRKKLHKKVAAPKKPEELEDPKPEDLDLKRDKDLDAPDAALPPDDKPKALPDTDIEPKPDDEVPPPPEEVLEPEQPIEMRKEYLGKTDDTYYYFVTTEGEGGNIEDFVLVDQEGAKKFTASENDIEIAEENIAEFIIDAIRDANVASIERSIFMKYIYPKLIEDSPSDEEYLEEPNADKTEEEKQTRSEEEGTAPPEEVPRESKVRENIDETKIKEGHKLVWGNEEQLVLWNTEMSGQVSDGYWENSRPHDHYRDITGADASFSINPSEQGSKGFRPKKSYNFANKTLLDLVGQRALDAVKISKAFPNSGVEHEAEDILEPRNKVEILNPSAVKASYWRDKWTKVANALNITDETSYNVAIEKIKAVSYEWKDMVKDLKAMSTILKTQYERVIKENILIETKVIDDTGNEFTVYLLDEGGTDTVIEVNGRKFNFSQDFASMWRDEAGVLSEAGLKELALDALANLGDEQHTELISQMSAEESEEFMDENQLVKQILEEAELKDGQKIQHFHPEFSVHEFFERMREGQSKERMIAFIESRYGRSSMVETLKKIYEDTQTMEAELDVLDQMSMEELLDAVGETRKDLPEKEDLIDELMLRKFGKEYSSYLKRQVGIESKENNEGVDNMDKTAEQLLAEATALDEQAESLRNKAKALAEAEKKDEGINPKDTDSPETKIKKLSEEDEFGLPSDEELAQLVSDILSSEPEEDSIAKTYHILLGVRQKFNLTLEQMQDIMPALKTATQMFKPTTESKEVNETDVAKGAKALIQLAKDALKNGDYAKAAEHATKLAEIERVIPAEAEKEVNKEDTPKEDKKVEPKKEDKPVEDKPKEEPKEDDLGDLLADESEDLTVDEAKDKEKKAKEEKVKKEKKEKEAKAKKDKKEKEAKVKKEKEVKAKKESKIPVNNKPDLSESKGETRLRDLLGL